MSPLAVERWIPFRRVHVEAHTISETDLVELQIVLDRAPDRPWTGLFNQALAERRRSAQPATFLGRYILMQPPQTRAREDATMVELAIVEANQRYEREVVLAYGTTSVSAA